MVRHSSSSELVLPQQLQPDFDASAQVVHEAWRSKPLDLIQSQFRPTRLHEAGDQSIRYAVVEPTYGEADPEATVVMPMPAGKTWTPETFITASVVHELVNPDGRLIVLPNNNNGDVSYSLSKKERKQVAAGNYAPLSERQTRLCEALGIDSVALVMGHSLGATLGASFGNVASGSLQLRANLLNEAPNTFADGRSASKIRKSVLREKKQLVPGYRNIGLPALEEAVKLDNKLAFQLNLLRFALGSNLRDPNPAINGGFKTGQFYDDVAGMLAQSELATVLFTNANDSTVGASDEVAAFSDAANMSPRGEITRHDTYDGYHVTGSNPFVLGLLARRALQQHEQLEVAGRDYGIVGEPDREHAGFDQEWGA